MLFKKETPAYGYEIVREAGQDVMYVNFLKAPFVPSIAEQGPIMARIVDYLIENPNTSRVVLVQQRNYSYSFPQVALLAEVANLYNSFIQQVRVLSPGARDSSCPECTVRRNKSMTYFLSIFKQDPVAAYYEMRRFFSEEKQILNSSEERCKACIQDYLRVLERVITLIEKSSFFRSIQESLPYYKFGERDIYSNVFRPDVVPNFTFTRLMASLPSDAEIVKQYMIAHGSDESTVTILKKRDDLKYFYHLMPPEYSLSEDHYYLMNLARNVLVEHSPKSEEFTDPERTRHVFFNVSKDLLRELSTNKRISLTYSELDKLANILVRYTIGFGILEVLLQDENLQDIVLNAPASINQIFVRHSEFDECVTNVIPSQEDVNSWAAKFRIISGRPLDEANPVLDTNLNLGGTNARVAIIQQPLSPSGIAYAFRRHRDKPWTLSLFIKNKMINSLTAGLLSFLIDGSRTLLVAGTRSSGKCVDGNTLIQLSDGSITKIKEMVGEKKKNIEDGQIYNPPTELKVSSLANMNISDKPVTDVWKRSSPERVIRIKTKSGKEIITTKEHPYFVYKNGMSNRRADNLAAGELIVTPRSLKTTCRDIQIDLKNNPYLIGETEDYYVLKGRTNSQIIKFPKKLSPELAWFIGLIIGDGHLDDKKLEFNNNCTDLRDRYIGVLKIFGANYREFNSRTTTVVQVSSRVLSKTLSDVFNIPMGNKANKIRIPEIILQSDNKILASFLKGYFDTDGYCPSGKRDLELGTASKRMSEELQLALLRFGIVAFTKTKAVNGTNYYRVLIRGHFANEFGKQIGFSHPKKKQRMNAILSSDYLENTNIDVIPEGNLILRNLRKTFRVSPKQHRESGKDYWAYENNQYRVSRKWFKNIVDFYEERYNYLTLMTGKADILRKIAYFDLGKFLTDVGRIRESLGLSYNKIALQAGLSERGVRKALINQRVGSLEVLNKLSEIQNLSIESFSVNSFIAGTLLSEFRNELNISNEELAFAGVSLATVTNLFNGVYTPRFRTLQKIARKTLEIYDSTISTEAFDMLSEAKNLANSDIFWDEIILAEEIDKIDDYVYDLTVEDTHNFVANGLIAHNTSLLGALMLEIMPKSRIIVLEDTAELPVEALRELGYDILKMKVRSALLEKSTEVAADEGIRTSLRLGDSSLIVGEVRSIEARALYEAMRVGALANVVAGTIHGASPYGVFDRVVNDLGVPATSFKATDCIIVANPVKSPDGLKSYRRVIQLAEVRKHWTKDPQEEHGFVDLLRYNVEKDELEPTDELINGDSEVIKAIAANVRGWAGNWDAVWDNILLRGKIKEEIVSISDKMKMPELLEAPFNSMSNAAFYKICEKVTEEIGTPHSSKVFPIWQEWLKKAAKELKARKI